MKYIILAKNGNLKAIPLNKKAKSIVKKGGYEIIASSETKEKAEGMIMGLNAHVLVEKYAGHLPYEIKARFKSDIAQLATNMYNEIIK